jgi:hypothetical protein
MVLPKNHKNKDLVQDGWMTVDEFVDALIPGLREYLKHNWGNQGDDRLNHPEDLFTNASIYLDVACHVSRDFISCRHVKEH